MKEWERERERERERVERWHWKRRKGRDETKLSKWPIGRQHLQDAFGRFVPRVLIQRRNCRVRNISRRRSRKWLSLEKLYKAIRLNLQFYFINTEMTEVVFLITFYFISVFHLFYFQFLSSFLIFDLLLTINFFLQHLQMTKLYRYLFQLAVSSYGK